MGDLNISLKIFNRCQTPFHFTTGLQSYLAKHPEFTKYVKIIGLGLLPFLDISNPAVPTLESDTEDLDIANEKGLDRWYTDTMAPSELFFNPGDRSQIKIIEREGFNNIHLWNPKEIINGSHWMPFFGFSPCHAITPIKLEPKEKWTGAVSIRWLPV